MNIILPDNLLQVLTVSIVFSIVMMALIQKCKTISIVQQKWQLWLVNLIFSFLLGIPFGMVFYQFDFISSIWIGVFSFIGAPTLYDALKNYNPASLSEIESDTSLR